MHNSGHLQQRNPHILRGSYIFKQKAYLLTERDERLRSSALGDEKTTEKDDEIACRDSV